MDAVLEAKNINKFFSEVQVLKNVNFNLKKGEVHGIVGANGSGKSTFLNILFGSSVIHNTGGFTGEVFIEGKKVLIKSPSDAIYNGIGMVHQELSLINGEDIAYNIKITRENTLKGFNFMPEEFTYVSKGENMIDASKAMEELALDLNIDTKVKNIPLNLKQFIEIAREIDKKNLKVLILDEPTAPLNKEDAKVFIEIIKKLRDNGTSIIFITHRLDEIMDVCDRITIFRDGEIVETKIKEDTTIEEIAIKMIAKKIVRARSENSNQEIKNVNNEAILRFNKVNIFDGNKEFKDLDLNVFKGEILGITSLAGHGQNIFNYGIMNLYNLDGEVIYEGKNLNIKNTEKVIEGGIVMIPDERKELGLMLNESIKENIVFTAVQSKHKFLKKGILKSLSFFNNKEIDNYAEQAIMDFNIKCTDKNQYVGELSGGNQQKVCIARALTTNPKVLFIGEPTRGIDIYSKELILNMLLDINRQQNTTVVVASSEIDELRRICSRIVVMYEGEIFDILSPDEDEEVFSLAISGRRRRSYEKN
ncbi:MAG: sugar ABC transporter ATP-binding protein [Clostridium sp.]|uniref:sugar ABC transporter ATP-binding protein n=1 Tax=Clostridium sp. TaxID=1506 RepID=UPI00305806B9